MSEHNKNFYSLKEVERCLDATKEFQDGEELYYFIGALRYVCDENKQLKYQLQQKENIIKEVREKVNRYPEFNYSNDYMIFRNEIKEILDKEVN